MPSDKMLRIMGAPTQKQCQRTVNKSLPRELALGLVLTWGPDGQMVVLDKRKYLRIGSQFLELEVSLAENML